MTNMQRIAYRRLFKNHGSSVGFWEGWVDGHADEAKIILQYARTMDGKVTRKEHPAKRKNVGRSNETTCLEQAQLELYSRSKKQLDKGYVERREDAAAPSTNTLGLTKPMLAQPIEKVKPEDIDWDNAFAQPKLDGFRLLFSDGILYTRQGKTIETLSHIVEAIESAGIGHLHLDGELYLHGKSLQEISSLVKREQEGTADLVYYVYDSVGQYPWIDRFEQLESLYPESTHPSLKLLETRIVSDPEQLQSYHEKNLSSGYEGTMLRWGVAGYQDGKRSKHLIKLKQFSDSEFEIVRVERGVPYVTAKGTFEVPVWVLVTEEGKEFRATAPGNMEEKNRFWMERETCLGRQATIKYHYYSKDGVPQLPVALRIKEDL